MRKRDQRKLIAMIQIGDPRDALKGTGTGIIVLSVCVRNTFGSTIKIEGSIESR